MIIKILSILFLVVCSKFGFSQLSKIDTIAVAKVYMASKEYEEAGLLLKLYQQDNYNDLEANWLYALLLSYQGENSKSIKFFENALQVSPDNQQVKFDFAKSLFYSANLEAANEILLEIKNNKEDQAEVMYMLAYISYWQFDFKEVKRRIKEFETAFPESNRLHDLKIELELATSPVLNIGIEYQTDNQPLNYFNQEIEFGSHITNMLNPKFKFSNYFLSNSQHIYEYNLNNSFVFGKKGFSINLGAGVYKNFNDKSNWIGQAELEKKIFQKLTLKVGYIKSAYFSTIASSTVNLTQNNAFTIIEYKNPKLMTINALYNYQFFDDNNNIQTFGLWILSKDFRINKVAFQLGYGYNYSNSKYNNFTSKVPLSTIILDIDAYNPIEGKYSPYFTPQKQSVSSGLFIIKYNPTKKISAEIKANIALVASHFNPYLYVDTNMIGDYKLKRSFAKTEFFPFEISAKFGYNISNSIKINLVYFYQETYYFYRNNISFNVNYIF